MKKMVAMQKKAPEAKKKAKGEVCCPECGHEFMPKMEKEEEYEEDED